MIRSRIVGDLPISPEPKTVYFVDDESSDQFDIVVTDDVGNVKKDRVKTDYYSKSEVDNLIKLSFDLKDYQVDLKGDFKISSTDNAVNKKKLTVQNGMGVLNLDIIKVGGGDIIGYLPANAPLPTFQVSEQTRDGGVVTLNAKSRTISSTGLQNGQRYIINVVGFFSHV